MRGVSGRTVIVGCGLAALLLGACGTVDDEEGSKVTALNLETGERQAFADESRVPSGWMLCIDEGCPIPERLGCQNLGPATCLMHPSCQLKLLCEFDIPGTPPIYRIEPGYDTAASAEGDSRVQDNPDGHAPVEPLRQRQAPQGCEFVCRGPAPQPTCDEIRDPQACEARAECDWEWIAWAHGNDGGEAPSDSRVPSDGVEPPGDPAAPGLPCSPEYCPLPPQGFCTTAQPVSCEQLDRFRCEQRDECVWDPPMPFPSGVETDEPDVDVSAYRSFCRPRGDVCSGPVIEPPLCPGGVVEAVSDERGCVVGYKCIDINVCPVVGIEPPVCPVGEVVEPIFKDNCMVGYECVALNVCPNVRIEAPHCPLGQVVEPIVRDNCVVGYKCISSVRCDVLRKQYDQVLTQAKQCTPYRYFEDIRCAAGDPQDDDRERCIMPPDVQACSTTVPDALGCMACPTYVNAEHPEAIELLERLRNEFQELGCMHDVYCPAIACALPQGAGCVPGNIPGTGSCAD